MCADLLVRLTQTGSSLLRRLKTGSSRLFVLTKAGWKNPSGFCWCEKRDLNPYGCYHTPLKRARLPVPPLSHAARIRATKILYTKLLVLSTPKLIFFAQYRNFFIFVATAGGIIQTCGLIGGVKAPNRQASRSIPCKARSLCFQIPCRR